MNIAALNRTLNGKSNTIRKPFRVDLVCRYRTTAIPHTPQPQPTHVFSQIMSEIKNPANAALSAARRQNATAKAHDEARTAVKDLVDRRVRGESPATLTRRNWRGKFCAE